MRAGAASAWELAWTALSGQLAAYLIARGAQPPDAADLVSEAFARMLANIDRFAGSPDEFTAWAYAIVRNLHVDLVRSAHVRRTRPTSTLLDVEGADEAEQVDGYLDAIQMLNSIPESQREIIVLVTIGGLSLRQCSYVLGVSAAAARKRYSRALHMLRALYPA